MRKLWRGLSVFVVLGLCWLVGAPSQTRLGPTIALTATSPSANNARVVAAPEDVGLSSERLERIANTVESSINDGRIAGAVTLVARHGKIAYFKAFGMADLEAKKPMRTDYWGGLFYTAFVIDPKEEMIAILMGQLHPTGGLNLDAKAIRLAYQAIKD